MNRGEAKRCGEFRALATVYVTSYLIHMTDDWSQPIAGSFFLLAAGLYLTFKGTAALDMLFHESLAEPRVPCRDCGYDLRGHDQPSECPECGRSFQSTSEGGT